MANNIHSLQQINALSQIRKIESLTICEEGNPVTQISVWKHYTLFRLSHMSIKSLNGKEVCTFSVIRKTTITIDAAVMFVTEQT